MKTARIGTILPWGGDGNEGFTASNIPKGWKVCDGQLANAVDYPYYFLKLEIHMVELLQEIFQIILVNFSFLS